MRRSTLGEILFWSAGAFALALYGLTAPDGLPWNASVRSTHPVWLYCVAMAWGHVVWLSSFAAAVSAGLIAALANRYLGWRVGLAAALVWIFLPGVWNGAITGERGVCLAAAVVGAAWVLNAILLRVLKKARAAQMSVRVAGGDVLGAPAAHDEKTKRGKANRIVSWAILGAAGLFAVVSATTLHSYRYGETASAYAREIVEEAGERILLLNGVCDEQIVRELESRRPSRVPTALPFVSFRNTEENRSNLVVAVRSAFPSETNLWVSARVGPSVFADAAVSAHPDRFYSMMGQSTTPARWTARWDAMKPYLASRDPFLPALRRQFAYEGNALGNALQEKGDLKGAWEIYLRVFAEIEPKNPAACVNLSEMLRRGYKTDAGTRHRIETAQADIAKLARDRRDAVRLAARIVAFGPVMRDPKVYEELCGRIRKRMEELEKKGEKIDFSEAMKTLMQRKDEMLKAFSEGDDEKAVRMARAILARREWRGFVPANMVLGEYMVRQGDYVAAEAFLRVAIEGRGPAAPTPYLLNDYAEVLRQLKRYDEAERQARKAVGKSGEKDWLCRMTLAQVLRDAGKNPDEVEKLVGDILRYAPAAKRKTIRKEFHR